MPDYRCYMVNAEGEVLFGVNFAAETLDSAVQGAVELRRTKNENRPSSRLIYAFEVWSESNRLFPESLDASPKSKQVAYPLTSNMLRHSGAV
jgi:hypothetical protein